MQCCMLCGWSRLFFREFKFCAEFRTRFCGLQTAKFLMRPSRAFRQPSFSGFQVFRQTSFSGPDTSPLVGRPWIVRLEDLMPRSPPDCRVFVSLLARPPVT